MGIDAKALAAKLEEWDTMVEATRFAMEQLTKKGDVLADHIEELETKLAKAVEVALEECPFRSGTPKYDNWWRDRRATIAELTGGKDAK